MKFNGSNNDEIDFGIFSLWESFSFANYLFYFVDILYRNVIFAKYEPNFPKSKVNTWFMNFLNINGCSVLAGIT